MKRTQMDDTTFDIVENPDRLIPVTKWSEYHPWPPIGGLRYLIFHEHTNGFSHCVVRKGRRVLISERRFFEWANNNQ